MQQPPEATTAEEFAPRSAKARKRWRLLQRAPGPEAPDVRDKAAAQRGMVILLAAGGAFWLAVAAGLVLLLR